MIVFGVLRDIDIVFFSAALFFVLAGLVAYFFYTFIAMNRRPDVSPYSGMPLRYAKELTFSNRDKVNRFLKSLHDFDNRPIDFHDAAFCRETGRIFPHSVTWSGAIKMDWGFIKRRFPGNFVSWGSLSPEKKKEIEMAHGPLFEYQREISSKNPSPRLVEEWEALSKPGPLYVDPDTKILMGWRMVPETDLEVLIIQKPISFKLLNIHQKP